MFESFCVSASAELGRVLRPLAAWAVAVATALLALAAVALAAAAARVHLGDRSRSRAVDCRSYSLRQTLAVPE